MTQMTTCDLHNATIARLSDEVAALTRELAAERERADMAKAEGIKEGMRMAAEIADQYASVEGIAQRIRDAILKEIGE